MNVLDQQSLQALIDQQEQDHPIGSITYRYVTQTLKRKPEKKQRKVRKNNSARHSVTLENQHTEVPQ